MSAAMRLGLIINGARAEHALLRGVVRGLREAGHTVEPRLTFEEGDAAIAARAAAERGVDAVVSVGGDGTLNEVANGLNGTDTPLGIIPLGTANDFARQVGIPSDPAEAMALVLGRPPVRIDTLALNGRRFVNVSTAGLGAEATAETPKEAKRALGTLAYAITAMRKLTQLEPHRARFAGPGFEHRCPFLLFAVGNGRETGGGTALTPRASLTDGLLDVCIVEEMPRGEFTRLLLKLKRGEHLEHPGVIYAQLPSLTVDVQHEITVNVDGEPTTHRELTYDVRPLDLRVHVATLPGETPAQLPTGTSAGTRAGMPASRA
jgi:lipid kinase YegS